MTNLRKSRGNNGNGSNLALAFQHHEEIFSLVRNGKDKSNSSIKLDQIGLGGCQSGRGGDAGTGSNRSIGASSNVGGGDFLPSFNNNEKLQDLASFFYRANSYSLSGSNETNEKRPKTSKV